MASKIEKVSKKDPPKSALINWWNPSQFDLTEYGPVAKMLVSYAIANYQTVQAGTCRGVMAEEEDEQGQAQAKFFQAIQKATNALCPFASVPIFGRGTSETWFVWPEGVLLVKLGPDGKYDIRFCTNNDDTYTEVSKILGDFLLPEFVRQPIYSLARGANGIDLGEVGVAGVPFIPENYEDDIVAAFDFIVDDLQRANPVGRLSIIQGDPGTGKTFLIRGLLHEVFDAVFVLIPPGMVEDLAGPELVPALIRARSLIGVDKPIVLLIEDADRALVPRVSAKRVDAFNESHKALVEGIQADPNLTPDQRAAFLGMAENVLLSAGHVGEGPQSNLSAISSLLNSSDGILGTALNLRIICTTNAKIDEIDNALMRPGRLSKQVTVGLLSPEKAQEVYARISDGNEAEFQDDISLSDVYNFHKHADIEQDKEEDEEGDDEEEDEDEDDEDEDDEDD